MARKKIQWSGWRDDYLRQHAFGKTDKELASYLGVSATSVMNRRREMFGRMRESKQQRYSRLNGIGIDNVVEIVKTLGLSAAAKRLDTSKRSLEGYLTEMGIDTEVFKNKVSAHMMRQHKVYIQNNKCCMSIAGMGKSIGKSETYVRNIMIDEGWIDAPGIYTAYVGDDYVCAGDVHEVADILGIRPSQVVYKAFPYPRSKADLSGGLYIFRELSEDDW